MEKLKISDIHPFVRKVGIVHGYKQGNFVASYDYRLIVFCYDGGFIETPENSHSISALDLCLISPGTPYKITLPCTQKAIVLNFDWTYTYPQGYNTVLMNAINTYDKGKIINKFDIHDLFQSNALSLFKASNSIVKAAHKMVEVFFHPSNAQSTRTLKLTGVMTQILAELLTDENSKNEKAERIYRYICENYDKTLTLDEVANHFHYHKTYINRLLNTCYNMSFKKIVIDVRLNEAVALLEGSDLSVAEISALLGFYDYKHFQQSFKNKYGVTPSKFRS